MNIQTKKEKQRKFDYLNQFKIALIIESIYLSKNIVSLQIKAHEVFIKPLKPREALLSIKESDDDESDEEESEIKTLNILDVEEDELVNSFLIQILY